MELNIPLNYQFAGNCPICGEKLIPVNNNAIPASETHVFPFQTNQIFPSFRI